MVCAGFVAFIYAIKVLLESRYLPGSDAYVYLVQTRSLIETGKLHFSDISPIYPLLALFYKITGSYETAYRVIVASIAALYVILVFNLSAKKETKICSGIFLAFVLLSFQLPLFAAAQFPKSSISTIFFIAGLLSLKSNNFKIRLSTIIWWCLAILFHKLGLVLVILYGAFFLLIKKPKILFPSMIAALLMVGLMSYVFPGTLHFTDLKRLEGFISIYPQFAPLSFIRLLNIRNPVFITELIVLYFVPFIYILTVIIKKKKDILNSVISIIIILSVIPFFKFDSPDLAYRLFITGSLLSSILLFELLSQLIEFFCSHLIRNKENFVSKNIVYIKWSLLAVIILPVFIFKSHTFHLKTFDPPYAIYANMSVKIQKALVNEKYDMLVAHKPLAEVIDWYTGIPVLPWQPEPELVQRSIWRVVAFIEPFDIKGVMGENYHPELIKEINSNYILVREDFWTQFKQKALESDDASLIGKLTDISNPSRVRPQFLRRSSLIRN